MKSIGTSFFLIFFLFAWTIGQNSQLSSINPILEKVAQDYIGFFYKEYGNQRPAAFRIECKQEEFNFEIIVSPVFYISSIESRFPSYYSYVDSSLILIYTGIEELLENEKNSKQSIIDVCKNYLTDNRLELYDNEGRYTTPLINAEYKYGYYSLTQKTIRDVRYSFGSTMYD